MICELGAELLKQIYIAEQAEMMDLQAVSEKMADGVGMQHFAETVQTLMEYGLVVDAVAESGDDATMRSWASIEAARVTPKGLSVLCHLGIL